MLGRQISQIQARIEDYRSRLLTGSWQPEELRLLAKLYASRANVDLEITLLRPQTQIATTAKCMGLKKQRSPAADRNASLNLRDINQNNRSQQGKSTRRKRSTRDAKMPRWTEDEVQRLIEVYGNLDNQAISRELGRSITSIANKAWQLGISKSIEQLAKVGRSNVNRRHSKNNDTTLASKTSEKETKPSPPKP